MENATPKKYSEIKHQIKRSQAQAKWLGFLYLLGIIGLTALACFSLATVDSVRLGVTGFWKPFVTLFKNVKGVKAFLDSLKTNVIPVSVAVLYTCMLLGLLVNVIRALVKLSWLFKRKASKLYGFNRNMYAMEDLAKLFSQTFNCVICFHLLIALVTGGIQIHLLGYIALGVGVGLHILLTPFVGNVSLYTTEDGIIEEKRQVGNFTPILRNVLQLVATGGILYFLVKNIKKLALLKGFIVDLTQNGLKAITGNPKLVIVPALSLVLVILVMCMTAYALGITEFDSEGARGRGRKGYLWISLLTFIVATGMYVVGFLFAKSQVTLELIYIALIALGMFVIEILLRKYPRVPVENKDEVDVDTYLEKDEETYGNKQGYTLPAPYPFFPYPHYPPQYMGNPPQITNGQNKS